MTTHEFEIAVRDLDAGGKAYKFPIRAAWVRGALEGTEATTGGADGTLDVRVSKSGADVVLHGTLDADLVVPCARCLEPTALPVHQQVSALFVPAAGIKGSTGMDDEYEFNETEADILPYDGEVLVLDTLIRDELALEVPMTPLCSEDCAGISAVSQGEPTSDGARGDEPAIDPRLAPLLRFKKQNENKKE